MAGIYPQWLYSDVDPPQLVAGPTQQATLPAGFSTTPSPNAMVLPVAIPPAVPQPVLLAIKVPVGVAPVVVKALPVSTKR